MLCNIVDNLWIDLGEIVLINYDNDNIEFLLSSSVLKSIKIPDNTGKIYERLIETLRLYYTGEVPLPILPEKE